MLNHESTACALGLSSLHCVGITKKPPDTKNSYLAFVMLLNCLATILRAFVRSYSISFVSALFFLATELQKYVKCKKLFEL